ncbi:MAG: RecQ family ATP-dependent DNA helicase [Flavobacteriales bacterium]|nr:RecQ family ATP-dependent DNA helicase [Flavobacteriales bacterium]
MNQQEIIESVLSGKDTVALLPTGGGKSIIYQLPALLSDGVCLVISPLLALMKDQVLQLESKGIPSAYITSEMSSFEQLKQLEKAQTQEVKILYLSPERISNYDFINALKYIKVSFIAIDEAHCVSEWGNDFRPSYLNIKDFRKNLGEIPCIALTATATQKAIVDIVEKLDLKNATIIKSSFERKNISIQVLKSIEKVNHIEYILKKNIGSGLIYCRTRKETENLSKILKNKGLHVDFFHAGLSAEQKQKKQQAWTNSSFQTLVCTNAFGMGIDKADVRFVIHYAPSYSLENYYQEIGRAGRDGSASIAYLLWNEFDMDNWQSSIVNTTLTKKEYQKICTSLFSFFFLAEGEKSEKKYALDLEVFKNKMNISKAKIKRVLTYLENASLLQWKKNDKESKIKFTCNPNQITYLDSLRYQILEYLSRNVMGVFSGEISFSEENLSTYFGITKEQLKNELKALEHEKWIEYFSSDSDTIRFLQARKDDFWIHQLWKNFKQSQENTLFKFKELEYFITQNSRCRVRMVLGYFSEPKKENCGICDVCMQKKQKQENFEEELIRYIKNNTSTLQDILIEFNNYERQNVLDSLQELLSDKKIKNKNFIYYSVE